MCNRYAFVTDLAMLDFLAKLGVVFEGDTAAALESRYNLAPTSRVAVIRAIAAESPTGRVEMMRWGLVPPWAQREAKARGFTNARAETAAQKPAFRAAFKKGRCMIPASGFYEWRQEGRIKQPYYITRKDGQPLLFAGLHAPWTPVDEPALGTCAILTTEPNELMTPIHDRMPAILPPDQAPRWLDPAEQDPENLSALLRPFPADLMTAFPVSTQVNSPTHQGPDLIQPVAPAEQLELH